MEKPTKKQLEYISTLERKTKLKFKGKTKQDAMNFISFAKKRGINKAYTDRIAENLDSYFKKYNR